MTRNVSRSAKPALVPQLGVLVLMAVLDQCGHPPAIVNLNQCYYDYLQQGRLGNRSFLHPGPSMPFWLLELTVSVSAQSAFAYPVTIRIAEYLKCVLTRNVPFCSGGPQASTADLRRRSPAFPFIDYVLRGEADKTLPLFLDELASCRNFAIVPGLTWRSPLGPCRNPNAPVIRNLDALPCPRLPPDRRIGTRQSSAAGTGPWLSVRVHFLLY